MSVSLYRKYRSKSLDEIVGQKGVVKALKAAVDKGALSHAYLFTGPRGVGKTSIARILAFAINQIPYNSTDLPVDIIEIDAASNRGIEEIRDLREKVKVAPVSSKYKVYIIDEVHMLTTPAFNALLKTLEEPPAHIIFILATTEGHKLPETIISRTQRYNFSLATLEEVTNHLQKISDLESIKIEKPALELIAIHSGGSMRDALSTLDHVRHLSDNITLEDVRTNIGLPSQEIIDNLLKSISSNDAGSILNELKDAEQNNISPAALANGIIDKLKTDIQDNSMGLRLDHATKLIKSLSEIEASNKPNILLTVALLGSLDVLPPNQPVKNVPAKLAKPKIATVNVTRKAAEPRTEPIKEPAAEPKLNSTNDSPGSTIFSETDWQNLLEDIRSTHNTLYSVLRIAQIEYANIPSGKLNINFQFPFHKKRITEQKNMEVIYNKLKEHGFNLEIKCGVINKQTNQPPTQGPEDTFEKTTDDTSNDDLSQIRGIFDGAEAME